MAFGDNDIGVDTDFAAPKVSDPKTDVTNIPAPKSFGSNDIGVDTEVGSADDTPWHSFITGAGRDPDPDMPELGTSGPKVSPFSEEGMKMLGAYVLSAEDQQIADIAEATLPGAKQKKDSKGNLIIEFDGKDYKVNRPGASEADILNLVGQMAAYIPSAFLGFFTGGAGAVVTSYGLDKATEALGSKQGVSKTRMALGAGGHMLGQKLSPLAASLWKKIRMNPKLVDEATGKLTKKGQHAAKMAGVDPEDFTKEIQESFTREVNEAVDPVLGRGAAGRMAGKEFDIPLTKGQATGNIPQQAKEEAYRHGATIGDTAWDTMNKFDDVQQQAMQDARRTIQNKLAGGDASIARHTQAGDIVGGGLRRRAEDMGEEVTKAYTAAGKTNARIAKEAADGLHAKALKAVSERPLSQELTPATQKALSNLRKLENMTKGKIGSLGKKVKTPKINAFSLKMLESERRKLLEIKKAAKNPTDAGGIKDVINQFDEFVNDAFENQLMAGDPKAIELMKKARSTAAKNFKLFGSSQSKDQIDKTIRKIVDEEITPEQVVNLIWGKSKISPTNNSVQIIRRIKQIAGEGSEELAALKEAQWLKMSKEIADPKFSAQKFKTRLNTLLEENKSFMDELYSPDELAMFERFRDEVMKTVTDPKATNPAKSGYTVARLAREWVGRIGQMLVFSGDPIGAGIAFTAKRTPSVLAGRGARAAIRGAAKPRHKMPLFRAAVTGTIQSQQSDISLEGLLP